MVRVDTFALHQGAPSMNRVLSCVLLLASLAAVASCTSNQKKHQWAMASEAEVADALDQEFEKAAKGFVKLKKDGVLMFCKKYREVGSNIPTLKCITEAQLRTQVQNMTKYRDDMRNRAGKCTRHVGCSGG
jgi:hypothetical protein